MAGRKQVISARIGATAASSARSFLVIPAENRKRLPFSSRWKQIGVADWRRVAVPVAVDGEPRRAPGWNVVPGSSHNQPQGCVETVDLDVNPSSPYNPKDRL
jgi:hypothetical protein